MKRSLLLGLALVSANVYAQNVIGRWEFNDSLTAAVGSDAMAVGLDLDAQGNVVVVPVTANFADIAIGAGTAKVAVLDGNTFFQVAHSRATGNGGGSYLNNYTLIMDVYFDAPLPGFISLYQTNSAANGNDGDWFIRSDGGMGISGNYTDDANPFRYVAGAWRRVALTIDPTNPPYKSSLGNASFYSYVDGQVQNRVQTPSSFGVDGRFSLNLSSGPFYLFADEDEETAPGYVNSAVIIDCALTPKQLAAIGGATATGIPDPSLKGTATLSDFTGAVGAKRMTISFFAPGGSTPLDSDVVSINDDGAFSYYSSLSGSYDVLVKVPGFLAKRFANVTLPGATGLDAALINGDIDDDNAVTVFDYTALSDAFDSVVGDALWNAAADLDGDGAVTVFDYSILSNNFDQSGDN